MPHDCVDGMVLVSESDPPAWNPGDPTGPKAACPMVKRETYRPCQECAPKTYEKWSAGKFQRGLPKALPPVREPPPDYQEVIF